MNIGTLIVLATTLAVPANGDKANGMTKTPSYCNFDENGYCEDPVVTYQLTSDKPNSRVRLSCSLGTVLVVQLPQGDTIIGDPALGNAAIFRFKLQEKPLNILLWPTMPESADLTSEDLVGATSNLQINMASGINILLELQISYVGVQRLVLRNKELEKMIRSASHSPAP